jgi:hypothetical protein
MMGRREDREMGGRGDAETGRHGEKARNERRGDTGTQ